MVGQRQQAVLLPWRLRHKQMLGAYTWQPQHSGMHVQFQGSSLTSKGENVAEMLSNNPRRQPFQCCGAHILRPQSQLHRQQHARKVLDGRRFPTIWG